MKKFIKKLIEHKNNKICLFDYQQLVLDKIVDFYKHNNIGRIIWACGLGKTLTSVFIVKKLNCSLVLYGVPSIYLQKQIKNENNILYIGWESENLIQTTTNIKTINTFIKKQSNEYKFIITTYTSCNLLLNIHFDFKIGDEAHHLVGFSDDKSYEIFHKIKATKTLFMTATEKIIETKSNKELFLENISIRKQ